MKSVFGKKAILLLALAAPALDALAQDKDPKDLVSRMVRAIGGVEGLYAKKDVQYRYLYRQPNGNQDISIERYLFDGELSWAEYSAYQTAGPEFEGKKVTQGYSGKSSWVTVDGVPSEDPGAIKRADFLRKTNFYWFAMMFKLLDPGLNYAYEGTRNYEGVEYDLVKITFGDNVGDAQDTYLLYINPYTDLVDLFLFTVMDFGVAEPFMMKVDYTPVEGLMLPAVRRYAPATWAGDMRGQDWAIEIMTEVKFNNGFKPAQFEKP